MLFKAQIAVFNKGAERKRCTIVFESHDRETAPTAITNIAFQAFKSDTVETLSLDALEGGFTVLGKWPT